MKRALTSHSPDGELYIVQLAATWDADRRIGSQIVAAAGPIARRDLGLPEPLEPSAAAFDAVDDADVNLDADDVEWLNAEEAAGRLLYPIGVR